MGEESVVSELIGLGWSRQTLAVWHRAKYRCEYCGCDLLASDADYFYGSQVDHVVPGRQPRQPRGRRQVRLAARAAEREGHPAFEAEPRPGGILMAAGGAGHRVASRTRCLPQLARPP